MGLIVRRLIVIGGDDTGMNKPQLITEQFGRRVRELRRSKGLSQEELGELSGLDRTYIGGVERGARNLGLINVGRIARALEVTPSELLEGVK